MSVPSFVIESPEGDTEPMTTDILVELFDFGLHSEQDLDDLTADMKVNESKNIYCSYSGEDDDFWVISIRRVNV